MRPGFSSMAFEMSEPILRKLAILYQEHLENLDKWQKDFIGDLYIEILGENGDAVSLDLGYEDVKEYLSPAQITKINEAWEEANPR